MRYHEVLCVTETEALNFVENAIFNFFRLGVTSNFLIQFFCINQELLRDKSEASIQSHSFKKICLKSSQNL